MEEKVIVKEVVTKNEFPISVYLLMFLQMLLTGYIALMLRDGYSVWWL